MIKAETNGAVGELSSVVLASGFLYMGVCVLHFENVQEQICSSHEMLQHLFTLGRACSAFWNNCSDLTTFCRFTSVNANQAL